MKMLFKIAMSLFVLATASSCTKETLKGSGDSRTEVRTLAQFDIVHFSGIREAQIIKSNESKVEMTGYINLLNEFEARVDNGNLHFLYPNHTWVKNDNIKLKVYTNNVAKVYQSGDTKVVIGAGYTWDALHVYLSGTSHFEVLGGTANTLHVDGSGVTKVFARPLQAKTANVFVSGESQAEVTASEYLRVDGSGRSKVKYWGNPLNVDIRTSGTARVSRQ